MGKTNKQDQVKRLFGSSEQYILHISIIYSVNYNIDYSLPDNEIKAFMDIIRTSIGITKTFRNAGRLREIVSVFAKHGFDEVFTRALGPVIPNIVIPKSATSISSDENQNLWKVVGTRLRLSFEELGAPFIKLGQLLSTREDIFAEDFIYEMKLLRDQVKSIPFSKLKIEVERSLGKKIEEIFESVDETAIGTPQ